MINPWRINLRKTDLNEKRLTEEQSCRADLEQNQIIQLF